MANIECPHCKHIFDSSKKLLSLASISAGAGAGALVGRKIGVALGPHGAIAGTIPGIIFGSLVGFIAPRLFATCPCCSKAFKTL